MCGILGFVEFSGDDLPGEERLRDLASLLAHRGPDGAGVLRRPGVALGHRRLAIVDVEHGDQPWISPDGRTALVYNGEIYEHEALRERLAARGHAFRTRCDTEVVLAAWSEWGEDCVHELEGMFAFAVVELDTRRVFVARDRLGVKPLYLVRSREAGRDLVAFASEPAALLASGLLDFEVDAVGLSHYLTTLQVSLGSRTLVRGLELLEPGHRARFGPGEHDRRGAYWDFPLPAEDELVDPGEVRACEELREELRASVVRRLRADTPVGCFLSGGIDSTVLTTIAAAASPGPLDAATVGFDLPGYNEFHFAREAAAGVTRELSEVSVTAQEYFAELGRAVGRRGMPLSTPNELPMYFMASAVRDRFPVALSGEGADELLAGYGPIHRSPFDLLRARALEERPGSFRPDERRAIEAALEAMYGGTRFASPADHYLAPLQWVPVGEKQALLTPGVFDAAGGDLPVVEHYLGLFERVAHVDPYRQLHYAHLKVNLPGLLLRVDAATMAAGLEARVPFTDPRLVEWSAGLPFHYKLRWRDADAERRAWGRTLPDIARDLDETKVVLRRAYAGRIPDSILERPKQAFAVPITSWLTGEWRTWAAERVLGGSLDGLFRREVLEAAVRMEDARAGYRLWPLVNLSLWIQACSGARRSAAA